LLDTITSESPSLTYEESNRLYQEVMKDYEGETKYKMFQKVKENEYFNALQVKFSYAITCHKSQGGQWNTVFVEQPYLPDGIDRDYIRWLYTAITRAKDKLYLIGFKDENFGG
jgi:superfamily I DNA/RNA helicase